MFLLPSIQNRVCLEKALSKNIALSHAWLFWWTFTCDCHAEKAQMKHICVFKWICKAFWEQCVKFPLFYLPVLRGEALSWRSMSTVRCLSVLFKPFSHICVSCAERKPARCSKQTDMACDSVPVQPTLQVNSPSITSKALSDTSGEIAPPFNKPIRIPFNYLTFH